MGTVFALRINSMSPFGNHRSCLSDRLEEAHALTVILAAAHRDASRLHNVRTESALTTLNHEIAETALIGIASLIAMAKFHEESLEADRGAE